jgi:uncharacterized membrane protein
VRLRVPREEEAMRDFIVGFFKFASAVLMGLANVAAIAAALCGAAWAVGFTASSMVFGLILGAQASWQLLGWAL